MSLWWVLLLFPGIPLLGYVCASRYESRCKRANMIYVRDYWSNNRGLPVWVERYSDEHMVTALLEAKVPTRSVLLCGLDGVDGACCRDLLTDAEALAVEVRHAS